MLVFAPLCGANPFMHLNSLMIISWAKLKTTLILKIMKHNKQVATVIVLTGVHVFACTMVIPNGSMFPEEK